LRYGEIAQGGAELGVERRSSVAASWGRGQGRCEGAPWAIRSTILAAREPNSLEIRDLWGGLERISERQVYALTSTQSPNETLDLFLSRLAAEAELAEILRDEPGWAHVPSVVAIELDGRTFSEN
jgi:hypothetical protein